MGIVYLKGIKKGDRIFYQEENNSINDRIEDLSKKKIRVLVQGYGTVEGGTAEGTRYKEGEKVTLIAKTQTKTINEVEYTSEFKGWYLDGKLQSTDTTYIIEVTKDATYTAIFDMEPTLIYYLDSNSEEQILVTKEATINSTTYTDAGIDKTQITKVVFGSSCTKIGQKAFEECTSLVNVTSDSVTKITINTTIFQNCTNLKTVKLLNVNLAKNSGNYFNGCKNLEYVQLGSIGNGIEKPNGVFQELNGANNEKLLIEAYLKDESYRFESFGNSKSTIKYYNEEKKLIDGRIGMYYAGTNIEDIEIPNEITEISSYAFKDCKELKTVKLPTELKIIGYNAFENCVMLKTMEIPSQCSIIGGYAFLNCTNLETVTSDTVTKITINTMIFQNCTNLKTVKLLNVNLAKNSGNYFNGCKNLEYVKLGSIGNGVEKPNGVFQELNGANNEKLLIEIYLKDESYRFESFGNSKSTIKYFNENGDLIYTREGA